MGGPGSGNHWRAERRLETGECVRLAMQDLVRFGLFKGGGVKSGSIEWTWSYTGRSIARAWYTCDYRRDRCLSLTYELPDGVFGARVTLVTSPMPTGTQRPWFACPVCSRRSGVLYVPPGERVLACRICLRLTYRSCNESHAYDRLFAMIASDLGIEAADVQQMLSEIGR